MVDAFEAKVAELDASGELSAIMQQPFKPPMHTSVPYALALHEFVCAKNVETYPNTAYPCSVRHASDMFRHAVARVVERMEDVLT